MCLLAPLRPVFPVSAYIQAESADASARKYTLSQFEAGRFMRLDASASRALNVTKERGDAADTFSLYKCAVRVRVRARPRMHRDIPNGISADTSHTEGIPAACGSVRCSSLTVDRRKRCRCFSRRLLNRCKTPMGKRLLLRWLHQPLLDLPAITRRLDAVEALSADPELRSLLRDTHLRMVPDVERITLKLERRKATLVDLCRLYQARVAAGDECSIGCRSDRGAA